MTSDVRDIPGTSFAVTNWTSDVALDCDAVQLSGAVGVTADVLGTLIKTLQEQGIVRGTTSA